MANEGVSNYKENQERPSFRVLYAEDDDALRQVTVRQLTRMGLVVEAVENGQLLLDKLATGEYDIVLTDNNMPVMRGIEALKEIRRTKDIPVIILTSGQGLAVQITIEEAGGVHMVKGTAMKDVYSRMVSLLEDKK